MCGTSPAALIGKIRLKRMAGILLGRTSLCLLGDPALAAGNSKALVHLRHLSYVRITTHRQSSYHLPCYYYIITILPMSTNRNNKNPAGIRWGFWCFLFKQPTEMIRSFVPSTRSRHDGSETNTVPALDRGAGSTNSSVHPVGEREKVGCFHDQLPLAVPCYDLVPVTGFTFGPAWRELRAPPAPLT